MLPSRTYFLIFILTTLLHATPSISSTETFIFGGCSQAKYTSNTPYENNLNSLLTSLVNSAIFASYNNFTIQASQDTTYGMFQCRGDLNNGDCSHCVAQAVSQLGTLCIGTRGGALQVEGCFVKYDSVNFLGVEDKTMVLKKCGPVIGYGSESIARRDGMLSYLGSSDGTYKPYRAGGTGNVHGVAQCTGDLSPSECQDCLSAAIQGLKSECGEAAWGDMFLAKCYIRYSVGGSRSHGDKDSDNNDEEIEKTLAILIGLIAGVALIIVFLSFLRKVCGKDKDGKY